MKRGLALFLAAMLAALALTGCGSGGGGTKSAPSTPAASESPADYDYGAAGGGENWKGEMMDFGFDSAPTGTAGAAAPEEAPVEGSGQEESRLANAKMVYSASIEAETQDYDACSAALEKLVDNLGGYMEYASSGSYGDGSRTASYTARVPSARFKDFLESVGDLSHVVSQDKNADNISERYYDTESRLTTQKTKMERLQMLLAKAENMEDIIDLENAIAETELQIEQLTGSLRHYDSLVDFATVDIRLREVLRLTAVEEAPPTFASRLGSAFAGGLQSFGDFLQDLAIFLAYNWLWLVVLALIVLAVVKLSRRAQARRMETFGGRPFQEPKTKREGFFNRKKKDGEPKNPDDKQP